MLVVDADMAPQWSVDGSEMGGGGCEWEQDSPGYPGSHSPCGSSCSCHQHGGLAQIYAA